MKKYKLTNNTKEVYDLIECPVCGKNKLKHAIKQHIINTAKQEVYEWYLNIERKPSLDKPHQDYIEKNTIFERKSYLNIKRKDL